MSIKKNIFAPLATGLGGATRRAARMLLATRRTATALVLALLTTAMAWADNVNLTEDTGEAEGTAARWFVNMPTTGTNTLTLSDATVTSFKVYDDGGKSGNYSNSCKGYLTLTAPTGYVLQLSGSITTERSWDNLTVYDGSTTSATKLLDAVSSSTSSGTKTAITTVTSSGQSMTLYFYSDGSDNYAGLDLTVTLVSTSTEYGITINNATGGSVATTVGGQAASTAKVNDVVTLTATPESGYMLSSISVVDGSGNAVAVTGGWYTNNQATFSMPNSAVTVTPTFTNDLTSLSINMPVTGTQSATIPMGVQSFKVYDDGGKGGDNYTSNSAGNYSNNCDGTLTLTAPTGYVLQLSGSTTVEKNYDLLTVYDNSEASGTKLLDAVSSTSSGTQTAITSVTSSGQSMTLYFSSDGGGNYAGLDLTVTVASTSTEYGITINNATGGSVATTVGGQAASTAKVNDVVTLTATPESGYMLSSISVVDGSGNAVAVTGGWYTNNQATFSMPNSAVTVTPTFTNDLTSLSINMPVTGTQSATIPMGVQSFKVYDDGGKGGDNYTSNSAGNYSNNCDGTLTLTAPTGYVLQLSGSTTVEKNYDLLTVYDNSEASGTKLLDAVSSTSSGTQTAITSVTSSGQSMTLYFSSDGGGNYAGLDLTVTVANPDAQYNINGLGAATGGSIAATVGSTSATTAKMNDVVTLTATPESGYMLSDLTVVDASSNAVAVTWDGLFFNTATFTMPASAVTVTPTFTNDLTSLSINMPATGTKTATIPSGVQSFKVYDDGGASGKYGYDCSGTLVLTAPAGYVLQLSGSITTDKNSDKLTVYDGSNNSATKLLDAVGSTSSGIQTAITTVTSSGQSMTLYFCSDGSMRYAGLDLTVTLASNSTEYAITVNNATGGSVVANTTSATMGNTITLTATPKSGYLLNGLSVVDGSGNAVAMDWNIWSNTATFTMPGSAVTVTPTFTNDLTSLYINMPKTGTKQATIPSGVQSFKVYDDGGASGNYSDNCDGTLTLTAPTGYVLQLSGSITTEINSDKLTVYDGSTASGTKLLNAVNSTTSGTQTAITTVSTGQSMTLNFYSNPLSNYAGLDLTVTLVNTSTDYSITVNTATGGSVAADKSTDEVNETITLTATPESGYLLSGLSVVDGSGNVVAVDWNIWANTATFAMPASAVTVTPTFTNDLTSLYINMPKTGTETVIIPSDVQSFKVYDDGGKDANYSNGCRGTLILTAPSGYVLQLSGSITTESGHDKLTVYDGSTTSGTKLLDAVSGTQTAITTVNSSGQSMTLYFFSENINNYAGLDLTVTLVPIDWATVNQGNSADPYMIYNKDQLLLLAHRVNGTNGETANDYEPNSFKLGADITFTHDADETDDYDENYEAIGGYIGGTLRYFKGMFDGDGHTVSGIRIRKDGSGNADCYQGLFGCISGGADIHDVHLTDARITGCQNVGGIVGYNNDGYIWRCSVTDSYIAATGNWNYGTICGRTIYTSRLTNNYYHGCTVNGTENATNVGCCNTDIADLTDNNGAIPAYVITLGDGVSTTALASAPENGFVYNGVSYYRDGLALSLASTLGSEAPEGYTPTFSANGTAISGNTYTVNSTDCDVTITAAIRSDGQQHEVSYMTADGTTQTAKAIALDGHETRTSEYGNQYVDLAAGWYYVGTDIDYTGIKLRPQGNITLILADGCTMHIGTAENRTGVTGIDCGTCDLTIYGQSLDAATAGTISYEGTGSNGFNVRNYTQQSGNVSISNSTFTGGRGIEAGSVTLNGGKLSVATNSKYAIAIETSDGDITINGGQLDATATGSGDIYGLYADGTNCNITLGWTRPDDRITASSYYATRTVAVATGQALTDGSGNIYTGTIIDLTKVNGKTLMGVDILLDDDRDADVKNADRIDALNGKPTNIVLNGRTLYKDGSWNTLCLPFDVDLTATDCPLYGATARTVTEASISGTTLNLTFGNAVNTLEAGTPYIIKWDGDGTSNIENPVFEGVTIEATKNDYDTNAESVTTDERVRFVGTYKSTAFDAENKSILLMGEENTLYYPAAGAGIGSFRAYFKIGDDDNALLARRLTSFSIDFGEDEEEATGIVEVEANTSLSTLQSSLKDAWHTLDGRRLQGKPTQGGIYIKNGKKITIK